MRPLLRLTAYALLRPPAGASARLPAGVAPSLVRDAEDRVVLVQASRRSDLVGRWFLPGGGVDHGEHPDDAVVREVREETGLDVRALAVRQVLTDLVDLPHRGVQVHTVRLVYDVEVLGGRLAAEVDGSSERLAMVTPAEAAALPLAPYVARALGLPPVPLGPLHPDLDALPPMSGVGGAADPVPGPGGGPVRRLRVGAYGVALRGRAGEQEVLLARLAHHVAATTRWTLPGGGIDHGETVEDGLARELYEETGLALERSRLAGVNSTHFTGRSPAGVVEDFHGVRLVHEVTAGPGEPHVVEVDGSTAEARWVPLADLARTPVTGLVPDALAMLGRRGARTLDG